MPHVRFMTPRTDVCAVCEDMRQNIQSALTEEEKVSAMAKFQQHIENAQDERQFYKSATVAAKEEYDIFRGDGRISDCSYGQRPLPCSVPMSKCHYTFDFPEQLHLPNHSRQVGPLYFTGYDITIRDSKNASFRSYSTFVYLLRVHYCRAH